MSANVWFEEVNAGLMKEIKDSVRIRDSKGRLISLDDKAIVVRKPEEDFKFEVFPCVSIYNSTFYHDPLRYNPTPVKVGEYKEENLAIMEEPAIPFVLNYQIDFWAEYQVDRDTMIRTWLMKHFRQFNLDVLDDWGVDRSCNCLKQGSVVNSDLVRNGERLLHSIIKYQIWVELDEEIRYNKPMANKAKIILKIPNNKEVR